MAQEIQLKVKCKQCGGSGIYNYPGVGGGSQTCPWPGCEEGWISVDKFEIDPGIDDILDKCNDILES